MRSKYYFSAFTGWHLFRARCLEDGIEPGMAIRLWHAMDYLTREEWMTAAAEQRKTCKECGHPYSYQKGSKLFCSHECGVAFNNRRLERGAEMYDLVMSMRFERKTAKQNELWTTVCRLASAYRDADKTKRDGRQSWKKIDKALGDIPNGYGLEGDGR